jgi:hypothetical protein
LSRANWIAENLPYCRPEIRTEACSRIRKDYGASAEHTSQQIKKSAARAKLPPDYIAFGFALFLPKPGFEAMDARNTNLGPDFAT